MTAPPITTFRLSVFPSFCLSVLAALVSSCVTNPATGERQLSLVSEQEEIAMGDQTAKSTRATIGDYPDSAVQHYIRTLGARLAATTERPGLPWSFEVIDDPEVNAFAAPGGKIFVTRGILPYLDSEAELAGVLGHECGHVTARHTAQQVTRQQLFGLGLAAGSILSSGIASAAGGIQQGLAVLFLSYSRGNEAQADELGFRYLRRARYDPREMSDVFRVLERVGQLSGGGKVPTWAATHPAPEDRLAKAEQRVAAVPADSLKGTLVNRDAYLRAIDGMVFGANPRQGGIEGTRMFALGGRAFTKSLADRLELPFPRAESAKVDYARGLPVDRRDEIATIVGEDVEVWAAGVELVMEELGGGDLLPGRVYLCGGGSRLPEVPAALRVQLEAQEAEALPAVG